MFLSHQDSNLSCLVQLFNVKQAIKCPKSDDVVAFKVELTESRKRIKTHSNTLAEQKDLLTAKRRKLFSFTAHFSVA